MQFVSVIPPKSANRYVERKLNFLHEFRDAELSAHNYVCVRVIFQLHVMAGPMAKIYGAATMAGKDEMNGRINPAMEIDDDLPAAEAERNRKIVEDVKKKVAALPPTTEGNTNF